MRRITRDVHQVIHFGVGVRVKCNNQATFLESSLDKEKVTCITCRGEAKGGRPKGSKNRPRSTDS